MVDTDVSLLVPPRDKWLKTVKNQSLERYGGNPTSHTPAHNVPAVAAAFRL